MQIFFLADFRTWVIDYDSMNSALKLKKKCSIYEDILQIVMSPGVLVMVALCGLLAQKWCFLQSAFVMSLQAIDL